MDDTLNPSRLLKQAVRLHQQGGLEAARLIYAGVLEVDPQNPDALHLMGLIAYQREDYARAVALITQAIEGRPLYPVYHKNLGNAFKAMGRLEQAIHHFLTAVEQQPDYVDAYIDLGNTRQIQRQYHKAVNFYQKALEFSPDNPNIYNNLGAAYHELGDLKNATDCFQTALQLRPGQKEVYNNLGNALQAAGKYDEAIECYRHAVQYCGDHPKIWLNLGNVCRKIGNMQDAIAYYHRALAINPKYAYAYNNLGNISKERSEYGKALSHYQKAIALEPDNPDFHFNCGLLHHLQNNFDDAVICYRKVIELEPLYAEAELNIVNIRHEQHAFDQALSRYPRAIDQDVSRQKNPPLYLGLRSGSNYGWGVCSDYLIRELSKLTPVHVLNGNDGSDNRSDLPGKLFQALTSVNFFPLFEKAGGKQNFGYTFFENELTEHSLANAKNFDLIMGGSTWCRDRLLERGIDNCDILIQGIDTRLFFPITHNKPLNSFVVFSGGKFELRKGQDLVLRALKILQDKYDDIILVNCWYNLWPQSIQSMTQSPHIRLPNNEFDAWTAFMNAVYQTNGLNPEKIKTFELLPNQQLRELYRHTDLGIFPNRCEGGTNLVLMEYMACAKPVIASNTSGHQDIVSGENALLLDDLKNMQLFDGNRTLIARWQEPSLEELVAKIEYAYHHRDEIRRIGQKAGADLQKYTWEQSAKNLLRIIDM